MVQARRMLQRLAREAGLQAPLPATPRWLLDPHLLLALVAAIPVWWWLARTLGNSLYQPLTPAAWLSFLLIRPVLEELVFRGLLQGQLLRLSQQGAGTPARLGAITWANLLTTAAFVALHLGAQPVGWALAVAMPSLVFGHLRERLGSVWPPVLLHMVYNAGFGAAAWVARYHSSLL